VTSAVVLIFPPNFQVDITPLLTIYLVVSSQSYMHIFFQPLG
jgi:hypothetical protein